MPDPSVGLSDSWRQTLDWCDQHPYPTRAEMENSEIGEALTGRDLDGLTDPDEWDRFVAGVRREVERLPDGETKYDQQGWVGGAPFGGDDD